MQSLFFDDHGRPDPALRFDRVVIAGAGGFGAEIWDYCQAWQSQGGPRVVGFLDDTPAAQPLYSLAATMLGPIDDYQPSEREAVIVAIGSVKGREAVLQRLWVRGAITPAVAFMPLFCSSWSQVGRGSVICPGTALQAGAVLAEGVAVNVHASIGHGARIGAFSVLSPYAALNGDACMGARGFLGSRATIYPKISIGDDCVVDTHTGVRADAGDRQMISSRGDYRVLVRRL